MAAREVVIEGTLDVTRMSRLSDAIVSADAPAGVTARFYRDEEGRYILGLDVEMPVSVACQRCLAPMPAQLVSRSQLAALWSDDQAEYLPSRYDPLVTEAETDLWQVVEDELLLALPAFNYHQDESCGVATGIQQKDSGVAPDDVGAAPKRENPFSVLAALKGNVETTD